MVSEGHQAGQDEPSNALPRLISGWALPGPNYARTPGEPFSTLAPGAHFRDIFIRVCNMHEE